VHAGAFALPCARSEAITYLIQHHRTLLPATASPTDPADAIARPLSTNSVHVRCASPLRPIRREIHALTVRRVRHCRVLR
jgi:hypothetical protein